MPLVKPPATVFVTGGSGFIGSWVIRQLLTDKYHVRVAVRSQGKGLYLQTLYAHDFPGQFEHVVVPNIQLDSVFDACLTDVEGVIHIASPLTGDPDERIDAAVNGTMSLLRSVAKHGSRVRRVVITSSAAALMEPKPLPCVYTEDDWNYKALQPLQSNATALQKYHSSKVLAERAAWDFVKDKLFDLVTILPTLVIGPIIHQIESKESTSYSLVQFYSGILQEKSPETPFGNWVDVRDVATAHVIALNNENTSGQRIIVSAGRASWQLLYDSIHNLDPSLLAIPVGSPGKVDMGMPGWFMNAEKSQKLGLQYRSLSETAVETVKSMREKWYSLE